MRFLLALIFAILAVALSPAESQTNILGGGMVGDAKATAAAPYAGAGDALPGFYYYVGVDCYTTAYTGLTIDVVDSSTGNTTGTRLQCSAGGHVSALVSASACTFVTGNACSPLATTCTVACNVVTFYGQDGNTNCAGNPCNFTEATNSKRAKYIANCTPNNAACARFTQANSQTYQTTNTIGTLAQPATYFFAALQNTNVAGPVLSDSNIDNYFAAGPVLRMYAGTNQSTTTVVNTWYGVGALYNGASSVMNLNGTETTTSPGAGVPAGLPVIGGDGFSQFFNGDFREAGYFNATTTTTQRNAYVSNARTRGGF